MSMMDVLQIHQQNYTGELFDSIFNFKFGTLLAKK